MWEKGKGYFAKIEMISPDSDEIISFSISSRRKWSGGGVYLASDYANEMSKMQGKRRNKKFNRLLSQGWKIYNPEDGKKIDPPPPPPPPTNGEDKKKGGEKAPRRASEKTLAQKRGKRGKRKKEDRDKGTNSEPIVLQKCKQQSSGVVYSPQPLEVSSELLVSAKKSAELLMKIVGAKSPLKIETGMKVDVEKLLVALEIDDNPLPPLEAVDERPKVRVLLTADCSGSCQDWSGISQAWAIHLSKLPDVDIFCVNNCNGEFWRVEDPKKLLEKSDVVIYLGDRDGYELCQKYAGQGATVIALDSHCASVEKPRICEKMVLGHGSFCWVDRVSAKAPSTWYEAIKLTI